MSWSTYNCLLMQKMSLEIMKGNAGTAKKSASQASMWKQGYEVVKVAFNAYHADQGRDAPLLASRRFTSQNAKKCDPKMMKQLLIDVSASLFHSFVDVFYQITHCVIITFHLCYDAIYLCILLATLPMRTCVISCNDRHGT